MTLRFLRRAPRPDAPVADLVAGVRRGDERAFGHLHARYAGVIHGILLARVEPEAAEDLAQEVFLSALERLDGLRDDAAFGGWICAIARNRAADHLRARRDVVPLEPHLGGRPSPPVAEARQALAAIRRLPPAYRETLILRLVEGLTGPEIADRVGMTHGSVRVNLSKGMKMLRAELGAAPDTARTR